MNREEEWCQLEEALTNLVDSISSQLSLRDRKLLAEFIENREFGVALEWLRSSIIENDLRPTSSQHLEIQRLAKTMGIDLS
ncbi:MafI family immunity protein [Bradyrhizobium liaoningense]|uniref:MafI family immunity protein n=1 Tax=Bradyrhizobium liaoningense TaxID=43992 RepID=UPI001BA97736|nr:MafI family immunity protein [Bradyrhizobium liaoningense]MBR0902557.1 MafI family immunity protein [Bradyrhizobium liaoningense]